MTSGHSGVLVTPIEAIRVDNRSRYLLDRAIILHCQPYRESSLFVDVFTEHNGRLRLLCKGARRGKHPLAEVLRSLNRVRVSFIGRGDLPLLTAAEQADGGGLALEGTALLCGFYLSELLVRLLPTHDPHPGVFGLCLDTLQQLATGHALQQTLRVFEIGLLEEIGYGLRLDEDTEGRAIDPDRCYAYYPDQGAVEMNPATPGVVQGTTLLALGERQFSDDTQLREAKCLMRRILHHHLNGRPLKSRELFRQPDYPDRQ
jgi:DNA repair protein RecO (recombination protein O)